MAKKVTVYDIVLSCPGDVVKEKNIIENQIEYFNKTMGDKLGIRLELKHWSTDSYSQSGSDVQDLLNKQFIDDADMIIGIFANRIGTPTESYESGTVEEILEAIKNKKQVFLYFSDVPVKTSEIDLDQKQSVIEFRERVKEEKLAYFKEYDSPEEFEEIILSDLSLYFLDLDRASDDKDFHSRKSKSNLRVKAIKNGKAVEGLESHNIAESIKKIPQEIKQNIESNFDKVNSLYLSPKQKESKPTNSIGTNAFSSLQGSWIGGKKDFELSDEIVSKISSYAEAEEIHLENNFFVLGELSKTKQLDMLNGGYKWSVSGSKDEEEKYILIKEIYEDISRLEEWLELAGDLESLHFVSLCISNEGKVYDTKITVKISLEKSNFVDLTELPIPGPYIIDEVNKNDLVDILFGSVKSSEVSEYSDVGLSQVPNLNFSSINPTYVESYQDKVKRLIDNIDSIKGYELFENEDSYILEYYFEEIKQHTAVSFPSKIVLNSDDSIINYEIISRENPDIVEGILEFN